MFILFIVEPLLKVNSQPQPLPFSSHFSEFQTCCFIISFTCLQQPPSYNSQFYAFPKLAVVVRLHCIYHIYPKYLNTLIPYHTYPKINTSTLLPIDMSRNFAGFGGKLCRLDQMSLSVASNLGLHGLLRLIYPNTYG